MTIYATWAKLPTPVSPEPPWVLCIPKDRFWGRLTPVTDDEVTVVARDGTSEIKYLGSLIKETRYSWFYRAKNSPETDRLWCDCDEEFYDHFDDDDLLSVAPEYGTFFEDIL